jgi:hypothetical protein
VVVNPGQTGTQCYPEFLTANCVNLAGQNAMSCANLYSGAAVVTAASQGLVTGGGVKTPGSPVNTYVSTIPSPAATTYCDAAEQGNGSFDAQKNCPLMVPVAILGRN